MSLDLKKLEGVRELAGGLVQARCPACAEGGHDRSGDHLRIYPDGRFGCCVHPKDSAHRKQIFALAGVREKLAPGSFTLRIKTPPAMPALQSVKAALTAFGRGTLGTPEAGLVANNLTVAEGENGGFPEFGTLGAAKLKSRAYRRGELFFVEKLKDSERVVPSVPTAVAAEPLSASEQPLPYLTPGGTLVIPFASPERYHWWKGGQSVKTTLAEVHARLAVRAALATEQEGKP